jgi:putative protease
MRRLTRADVEIRLDQPVGEGDLLELRPVEDPSQFLTVRAERAADAGETISCRASRPVPAGSVVRVIRSQAAMDAAARVAGLDVPRRRPVTVRVRARLGEPFSVMLSCADGSATATVEGFVVEAARTKAVTREDLIEHVGRMGQCPFEPVSFEVEIDEGVGMGFSAVHKVRSKACDALEQQILLPYETRGKGLSVAPSARGVAARLTEVREKDGLAAPDSWTRPAPEACALVATADAARAAFEAGAARIYAMSDALEDGSTWPEGVIPWLDEVCREGDHARLDPWVRAGQPVGVGNVSELALAASRGALPEIRTCIPVHNESSIVALESAGAVGFWLSPELTLEEVCSLAGAASVPVGLVVSGRARAMTSEHCVLQAAGRCIHDCPNCELRRRRLSLRDIDGNLLPVRTDGHGRSRIWAAHPLDATPQADALVAAGITRLMADATLLSPEECTFAVERVVRALAAVAEGKRPAPRVQGATSGHLFTGIG